MVKYLIEEGNRFGRWTVVVPMVKNEKGRVCSLCKCECGKEKLVERYYLIHGASKSCGCLQREIAKETNKKQNEFYFEDGYVIGITTNTNKPFYIDEEDYDKVKNLCWYEGSKGYIMHKVRNGNNKYMYLHRYVMNPPDDLVVDHINHNKADNRKKNLKVCTIAENCRNRKDIPKGIVTIFRGNRRYYTVQIKNKYMGCFKDYEKAKEVRDKEWGNGYD